MNYAIEQGYATSASLVGGADQIHRQSPTLLENIDRRIAQMRTQIEQLENVKLEMAKPGGMLNIPIDDLRQAMNY